MAVNRAKQRTVVVTAGGTEPGHPTADHTLNSMKASRLTCCKHETEMRSCSHACNLDTCNLDLETAKLYQSLPPHWPAVRSARGITPSTSDPVALTSLADELELSECTTEASSYPGGLCTPWLPGLLGLPQGSHRMIPPAQFRVGAGGRWPQQAPARSKTLAVGGACQSSPAPVFSG